MLRLTADLRNAFIHGGDHGCEAQQYRIAKVFELLASTLHFLEHQCSYVVRGRVLGMEIYDGLMRYQKLSDLRLAKAKEEIGGVAPDLVAMCPACRNETCQISASGTVTRASKCHYCHWDSEVERCPACNGWAGIETMGLNAWPVGGCARVCRACWEEAETEAIDQIMINQHDFEMEMFGDSGYKWWIGHRGHAPSFPRRSEFAQIVAERLLGEAPPEPEDPEPAGSR